MCCIATVSLNGKFHFLSNGNKQVKRWRTHYYNLLLVKSCEWADSQTGVLLFGNICEVSSVSLCPCLFSAEMHSSQSSVKISRDWRWLMQEVIFKDRSEKNIHKPTFFCKWDTEFLASLSVAMSWFSEPEFASAVNDVKNTEVNLKMPIARSVRVTEPEPPSLWDRGCKNFQTEDSFKSKQYWKYATRRRCGMVSEVV